MRNISQSYCSDLVSTFAARVNKFCSFSSFFYLLIITGKSGIDFFYFLNVQKSINTPLFQLGKKSFNKTHTTSWPCLVPQNRQQNKVT